MEGTWSVAKHSDTSKRCPTLRRKLAGAINLVGKTGYEGPRSTRLTLPELLPGPYKIYSGN